MGCAYLKAGTEYQLGREVRRQISSAFRAEADDVFQNDDVIEFLMPIEKFFVDQFYTDRSVNDNDIYDALGKIYLLQTGKLKALEARNRCEELIFETFQKVNSEFPDLAEEQKAKAILRILKSIQSSSGGVLGNRNYLELVYSHFNEDGQWSHLFRGEKDLDEMS